MNDYKRPMTLRECAEAEEVQPSRQVDELLVCAGALLDDMQAAKESEDSPPNYESSRQGLLAWAIYDMKKVITNLESAVRASH